MSGEAAARGKLRVAPLGFVPNQSVVLPSDPRLWAAVEEFCRRELGHVPKFEMFLKSWAVVKEDEPGDCQRVLGVVGLAWKVDVPVFHIGAPGDKHSLEEVKECYRARDMLIERAKAYLVDQGAGGHEVTIYVSPAARQLWERFFSRIGAKDANRVVLEV